MRISFYITFIFFAFGGFTLAAVAPLPPTMTPEQAVQVLKTSSDLNELTMAVKVATANTSTRSAVVDFLDGPSKKDQIGNNYMAKYFPGGPDALTSADTLRAWANDHPQETNAFRMTWDKWENASNDEIEQFFAQSTDPGTFEVFKHLAFSRSMGDFWGGTWGLAYALQKGSVQEPLYLDFIEYLITDTVSVAYEDSNNNSVYAGVMDVHTGQWVISRLTTAELAAAKTGTERRNPTLVDTGLSILDSVRDEAVFDRIVRLVFSNKAPPGDISAFTNSRLVAKRYQKIPILMYELQLNSPDEHTKNLAVDSLFRIRWGSEGTSMPPQLQGADPAVYPYLLHFIAKAYQLKLSDGDTLTKLADSKATILALYAKHGLAVPKDAEIDKLAETAMAELKAAAVAAPPAASAKNSFDTPKPTQAIPRPSSTPFYIFLGALAAIGFILYLRRK